MKAVVLAAGDGERLEPLTKTLPKAMLPIGRETVISRLLRQLHEAGVDDVCVVVGYAREELERHVGEVAKDLAMHVETVCNADYKSTSTAASTLLSEPFVAGDPFLLVDGDLVLRDEVVVRIVDAPGATIAYEPRAITGPEEMKLAVVPHGGRELVDRLGKQLPSGKTAGESLGLAHLDGDMAVELFAALRRLSDRDLATCYYEQAIDDIAARVEIGTMRVEHGEWIEIDFVTDYLQAVARFSPESTPAPSIAPQVLLCPGPVQVSASVRGSLLHADIGHRESEFIEVLFRTRQKLLRAFGVRPSSGYTDVILSGSGTAANEAVVSSYLPGKKTLVLSNGEFGNRIAELCRRHGVDTTVRDFGWAEPYRLEVIEEDLERGGFDAAFMVHHETSTGMLNPLLDVSARCSAQGVPLCVDAISSLGAEEVPLEESGIVFCTGTANKALAALPGLSFVCGKTELFERLSATRSRTVYLDLARHFEFEERRYQTPNTPAVPLFFALETALDELLHETLESRFARYDALAAIVRRGLGELGWETLLAPESMSRVLTTYFYPPGVDAEKFHGWVRRHNFVVYRGKGPLLGEAFQVATIGALHRSDVERFVEVVGAFDRTGLRSVAA